MVEAAPSPPDSASVIRSKRLVALLVLAAAVGVVASLVAWGFLELVFCVQRWVFTDLPEGLGYDSVPLWWSPVAVGIGAAVTSVLRLPLSGAVLGVLLTLSGGPAPGR